MTADRAGKLDGRTAIVTGAGRGIGRAIALKLAREGARIVLNDLDAEPAQRTAAAIRELDRPVEIVAGDVGEPDFGDRIVDAALAAFGALDIVVNNAGYIWNSTLLKHSDEQWQAMLDVHATAPFRILRAAGEHFRAAAKRGGEGEPRRKVVNVSSVSGVFGAATQASYAAGKAALIGLTKSLAKEWGRYGVNVNCVAFGQIETRLTQPYDGEPGTISVKGRSLKVGLDRSAYRVYETLTPLGRPGTPEEAAGAVYLFCIPESDYITGEVLVCSGGMTV